MVSPSGKTSTLNPALNELSVEMQSSQPDLDVGKIYYSLTFDQNLSCASKDLVHLVQCYMNRQNTISPTGRIIIKSGNFAVTTDLQSRSFTNHAP